MKKDINALTETLIRSGNAISVIEAFNKIINTLDAIKKENPQAKKILDHVKSDLKKATKPKGNIAIYHVS